MKKLLFLLSLFASLPFVAHAADSNITFTNSYGEAKYDTRTEGTNSEHRQVFTLGDPSTNAGVAPVTSTSGVAVELRHSQLATYSVSSGPVTLATLAGDIVTITGSATKTVKITRLVLSSTQTTAGVNIFNLTRRSSANSGGTSNSPTIASHDSLNSAATATALAYTVNPTSTGTFAGRLWTGSVSAPAPATAGIGSAMVELDFNAMFGQPITLRGTSEVLALNFNYGQQAVPTGLVLFYEFDWTEE